MKINEIEKSALDDLNRAKTSDELEVVRVKYLGRKGELTQILRSLKDLDITERRTMGPMAQKLRGMLEGLLEKRLSDLRSDSPLSSLPIDPTAPAKRIRRGHLHPLTLIDAEIRRIFRGLNFSIIEGPEVESEYYNFDALNIPAHHPAREMWDTFWVKPVSLRDKEKMLMRTHTSPVQVRHMKTHKPPFQIVVPGRVFRYEATDASHEINFYQLEGLMVGPSVSLANFKFIIEEFFRQFFCGKKIQFRYRPSYFPFVEPGLEVDIKLGSKWLEVMGAGMVHPRVFEHAGYNPRELQGFAFGVGIDRLAMLKLGVPDVRLFYSGDARFVRQFSS